MKKKKETRRDSLLKLKRATERKALRLHNHIVGLEKIILLLSAEKADKQKALSQLEVKIKTMRSSVKTGNKWEDIPGKGLIIQALKNGGYLEKDFSSEAIPSRRLFEEEGAAIQILMTADIGPVTVTSLERWLRRPLMPK